MTRLRLLAVALALSIASNAWADLKTYDVGPQYSQEIYAALKDILDPKGQPTAGRVELLPSGQILVNAGPETLAQVDQVLQALRARPVTAAPRVELQYWAVLGSRAPAANPPGTATPSALNEVLAEVRRVHGDLQFRALGTASLTTQSGQRGEIGGAPLHVEQTTFVQGETLNARIDMLLQSTTPEGPPPNRLEVGTSLRRGEFVVLGQSELVGGGLDGPVFFIVHWPEARAR
ncbi:MAG TPA: hypothetical protein VNA66_06095 [Gammaproteobacteria bacterium]|jgi:hypothetical protein|nr:hypothetical protein [Gammaproteobacteria bacterium]